MSRSSAMHDHDQGLRARVRSAPITFWESELFLRRDGKLIKIDKPNDATASRIASGCSSGCERPGRSAARRIRPGTARSQFRRVPQGRAQVRRAVRADRAEVARRVFRRRATTSSSTSWTTSAAGSRCSRTNGEWKREELPGLPKFGKARRGGRRFRRIGRLLPDGRPAT